MSRPVALKARYVFPVASPPIPGGVVTLDGDRIAAVGARESDATPVDLGDVAIVPGLVKGAWYPIHVNQSLPAVAGRYFLAGEGGDVFWNPDDHAYGQHGRGHWITLAALSPATVRTIPDLRSTARMRRFFRSAR